MRQLFQCEHCGATVHRSDRACPSCQHLFSGVRCPRCNFSASSDLFGRGCPNCGYGKRSRRPQTFHAIEILPLAYVEGRDRNARRRIFSNVAYIVMASAIALLLIIAVWVTRT